jgi:hypothetical protein
MPQSVDKAAKHPFQRAFLPADILSQLGETLSVTSANERPVKRTQPGVPITAPSEPACHTADEDAERWDGLS